MTISARFAAIFTAAALTLGVGVGPANAQVTAFKQAIAESASVNDELSEFYRTNNYAPLWTGEGDVFAARRAALIEALNNIDFHGLPSGRYDAEALIQTLSSARSVRDLGLAEVALSKAFLKYAHDVQTGMLVPSRIDPGIVREIKRRKGSDLLGGLLSSQPRAYIAALPPTTREYRLLMKEKLRFQRIVANDGWGPTVNAKKLEPGDSGDAVVALRNRLIAMGYLNRSASRDFDITVERGVRAFQAAHGLAIDGVAGVGTIAEINRPAEDRLKSIIVAMERERWTNFERGERHIIVNQADFTAKIIDHGEVTFRTRSVVGKNTHDRRSPEFSDVMEHMIVNPSWHVPRSIMTKEYLPKLQSDPTSVSHLIITDSRGRRVNREEMDFTEFSTTHFPFDMRQPPGARNALGRVKFMFPNKHNIYLHDTPEKHLFSRERRAFSHGCIRLADPFDFAYALLAKQSDDPKGEFQRILKTGQETKIDLVQQVPVHLMYRTAVISTLGKAEFRRDVYERDGKIWRALSDAGVALSSVQG